MTSPKQRRTRSIPQVRLVERFDAVLYPFDLLTLLKRLPEKGWLVPSLTETAEGITLQNPPSKGNCTLRVDTGNKTLGVAGRDLQEVIREYRELREFVRELFDLAPGVSTDYVEFQYKGLVESEINPAQALSSWWGDIEHVKKLDKILGKYIPSNAENLAPYGLRLALSGLEANRPDWVELTVTPAPSAGHKHYYIDILFRNEDSAITEQVAESAEDIIDSILNAIEKA